MKKRTNPFRLRAKSPEPEEAQPKAASSMSDQEIEEGIRQTRREILDLQHEELREREKARLTGDAPEGSGKPRNLGNIFKKKGFK